MAQNFMVGRFSLASELCNLRWKKSLTRWLKIRPSIFVSKDQGVLMRAFTPRGKSYILICLLIFRMRRCVRGFQRCSLMTLVSSQLKRWMSLSTHNLAPTTRRTYIVFQRLNSSIRLSVTTLVTGTVVSIRA